MNAEAELTELVLGYGGWLQPQPMLTPLPGQYVIALPLDAPAALPEALFPAAYTADAWLVADPLPDTWQPGMRLSLRGPLGHGFHLPATARRAALVALEQSFGRLLPLIDLALEQGAAVALCGMNLPAHLPSAVEVLPLDALPELIGPGGLPGARLALAGLEHLPARLGQAEGAHPSQNRSAARLPMPCGGLGECGICAVPVRKGWQHACTAGPVFDFENWNNLSPRRHGGHGGFLDITVRAMQPKQGYLYEIRYFGRIAYTRSVIFIREIRSIHVFRVKNSLRVLSALRASVVD